MPTILDSLFYKAVNTTSIPIGWRVRGGGEWPNGFNSGCFQLHTSQNVATLMPSLTSQSCGDSLPAICLAREVGAICRPPEHRWMPDSQVNEASVKVDR